MDISIVCPSYKRPSRVDTLIYLPSCTVYVSTVEEAEYKKHYPKANIVGVDPKYQGNVCRIRNKILDDHQGGIVLIIDDDLNYIGYHENKKMVKLKNEDEVKSFLHKYTVIALDLGVRLWGINLSPDRQNYREQAPFSLTSYIGSPFMVHINPELRFDERFSLKEDYDFTLQCLNRYRKVLRVNKFVYAVRQAEQTGGVADYRNIDREMEQLKLLQKKWGKDIVKTESLKFSRNHRTSKVRNFDINPIIHPPIKGV